MFGIYLNTTGSYPIGLYKKINAAPQKGMLVLFCPPTSEEFELAKNRGYIERGFCPSGYGYMIKKILAAKDDVVTFSDRGTLVNNVFIRNSKPLLKDKSGRSLQFQRVEKAVLRANTVLLMSDYSPDSFDGRYFGFTDESDIISAVRPLLTWSEI